DLDLDELTRRGEAIEVHHLVVPRTAAQTGGVRPRGPLDEHLERAADEPLPPLRCAALDHRDEPLEPRDLELVRDLVTEFGGLGATAGRVEEGEGAVVA